MLSPESLPIGPGSHECDNNQTKKWLRYLNLPVTLISGQKKGSIFNKGKFLYCKNSQKCKLCWQCLFAYLFFFFRKIDENYASPVYQSLRENAGDATGLNSLINSLTLFHNKIHDSHVCITLLRVKLGITSVPDLQAKTLIIYAAYLHNYMILSVTSIEEFPRRRR